MKYWLNITSGRGPEECSLFVKKIVPVIIEYCKKNKISSEILDLELTENKNYKSALISIENDDLTNLVKDWSGSHQWICESPYRKYHKRKNWFIGISIIKSPEKNNFDLKDLVIETMRSSGPGGQNVNKTDSAVRIKHIPTGITVTAREERSQKQNKELALSRLNIELENIDKNNQDKSKQDVWDTHNDLIRGNPVKVFQGEKLNLVS